MRIDYENLWRAALSQAFRGGRPEARRDPNPDARFSRAWTHGIAKNVNIPRTRAAHHEPLVNGFSLPGQYARMSAAEGHEQYLKLSRMIDRNLAAWVSHNTRVPGLLKTRPC